MQINLNPRTWFGKGKSSPQGRTLTARESQAMGPWTATFSDWVAREVAPRLYEAMREAVPPLDAAIDRLTTLDGILRIEGKNEALVREIQEWMDNVRVNDLQHGLQTFYAGQSNEMYEQGFSVGEFEVKNGDVTRLRVADSKGVYFKRLESGEMETWYAPPAPARGRRDGTDQIERVLRNTYGASSVMSLLDQHGYRKLRNDRLLYISRNPEADNPYGVCVMRSTEFVTRVLLVIQNATHNSWRRFGDPSFSITYKTKNPKLDGAALTARRTELATNLATALDVKEAGNTADFVNAIGFQDELDMAVLGADGQVLEIEAPSRHVLEQIVAKTGLPSWMLGFHWSTSERLAQRQGELVLQESRTRFSTRKPGLVNLIATMLRARGRTWKDGDWDLVQELPSLQDLVAKAQAGFLEAQTELMRSGAGLPGRGEEPVKVIQPKVDGSLDWEAHFMSPKAAKDLSELVEFFNTRQGAAKGYRFKNADDSGEPWAEDDDRLPKLERGAINGLRREWRALREKVLEILGLTGKTAKAEGPVFSFDPSLVMSDLEAAGEDFIQRAADEDSVLADQLFRSWLRGVQNASNEIDVEDLEAVLDEIGDSNRTTLVDHGMGLVRKTTARAYKDDILQEMSEGVYDGLNPNDVARQLKARFDAKDYDWQRLARSEITQAHADGKMALYAEEDVQEYDYVTAGDGRVSATCQALAAGGPYPVGQGPLPMRDSHPNCRCTVVARAE